MILIAYGTRPEWIKLKPLIEILKKHTKICVLYTGQQKDIGLFEYDKNIIIKDGTNRLNNIITSILDSDIFDNITHVIVQGDTASAFAIALSAYNAGIPISHIEAGLRTYDYKNPYPEESYRQMISSISSYHFCPTETDYKNILRERKNGKAFVVGNTVIDTLPELPICYDNCVLVTMHRRENLSEIKNWFTEIEKLAVNYPQLEFVIPLHPNVIIQKYSSIFQKVKIVSPMKHQSLLEFISKCKFIISDSGGIQEEAAFYNKKIFICRKVTERPAKNQILIKEPRLLEKYFKKEINNYFIKEKCPFGDGTTSQKICDIMINEGILNIEKNDKK